MAALHQNRQGSVNHGEEFGFYSERPGKPEEGREESHAFIYIKKKKITLAGITCIWEEAE